MRIGVDTRVFDTSQVPFYSNYTYQVLQHLTSDTAHQFHCFADNENNEITKGLKNVTNVIVTGAINFLSLKWWYDVKLPLALHKHKIDVFLGLNGTCSLTTKTPQLLLIHGLPTSNKSLNKTDKSLSYCNKYLPSFLQKAKKVATITESVKDELINRFKLPAQKISVSALVISDLFKPIDWEQREAVKEQYAGGFEYFVFSAGLHPANNLINVLKAFSIFKKWQKSGMKLLILAQSDKYLQQEHERLKTYKYRNDVLIKQDLEGDEVAKVVASAYAAIHAPINDAFFAPVLQAMQSEVAVITSSAGNMKEIAGDAVIYVAPEKPEEIAEAMKTVYKDENLRSNLIAKGKQRSLLFSPEKTTAIFRQLIEQAVSQ